MPSDATFTQGGVYAQTTIAAVPDRLRLEGSVRFGGASYTAKASDAPIVNGAALWPDDSLSVNGVGFRAAADGSKERFCKNCDAAIPSPRRERTERERNV